MGDRGPATKGRVERIINGNARDKPLPRRIKLHESAVNLVCPEWMAPEGKEHWARMVPLLVKAKQVTELDWPALVNMCTAWAEFQIATVTIQKEGRIQDGHNGMKCMHPAVKMQMVALKTVNAFMEKFGLQPTTRARLPVVSDLGQDGDSFQEFLDG